MKLKGNTIKGIKKSNPQNRKHEQTESTAPNMGLLINKNPWLACQLSVAAQQTTEKYPDLKQLTLLFSMVSVNPGISWLVTSNSQSSQQWEVGAALTPGPTLTDAPSASTLRPGMLTGCQLHAPHTSWSLSLSKQEDPETSCKLTSKNNLVTFFKFCCLGVSP